MGQGTWRCSARPARCKAPFRGRGGAPAGGWAGWHGRCEFPGTCLAGGAQAFDNL